MGQTKVVPQGIQNQIKNNIKACLLEGGSVTYASTKDEGNIIVERYNDNGITREIYEVIMVVIPRQSINHSEVRNG